MKNECKHRYVVVVGASFQCCQMTPNVGRSVPPLRVARKHVCLRLPFWSLFSVLRSCFQAVQGPKFAWKRLAFLFLFLREGWMKTIWQLFLLLLPVRTALGLAGTGVGFQDLSENGGVCRVSSRRGRKKERKRKKRNTPSFHAEKWERKH